MVGDGMTLYQALVTVGAGLGAVALVGYAAGLVSIWWTGDRNHG